MPFLFFAAIALIGATIHRHRDSRPHSAARTLEIVLVWWMVVAVGIAAIFGVRDGFLLAAVIAVSIAYLGDAYGHLHQVAIHRLHRPARRNRALRPVAASAGPSREGVPNNLII